MLFHLEFYFGANQLFLLRILWADNSRPILSRNWNTELCCLFTLVSDRMCIFCHLFWHSDQCENQLKLHFSRDYYSRKLSLLCAVVASCKVHCLHYILYYSLDSQKYSLRHISASLLLRIMKAWVLSLLTKANKWYVLC